MLILSRRRSESVVVGDDDLLERVFKVTVIEIARGTVTLGFEVAEGIPVRPAGTWGESSPMQAGTETTDG